MFQKKLVCYSSALIACFSAPALSAQAEEVIKVEIQEVSAEGQGKSLGSVTLSDSKEGLVITPSLKGLTPGEHGFHIHEKPSCAPQEKEGKMTAAMAAGGHFDPQQTAKHGGPGGSGHRGDLPKLIVLPDGSATAKMLLPGLSLAEVHNRSLMIHAGGDNYSDTPQPLGGGGPRIACGVIK